MSMAEMAKMGAMGKVKGHFLQPHMALPLREPKAWLASAIRGKTRITRQDCLLCPDLLGEADLSERSRGGKA